MPAVKVPIVLEVAKLLHLFAVFYHHFVNVNSTLRLQRQNLILHVNVRYTYCITVIPVLSKRYLNVFRPALQEILLEKI